MNYIGHCQCGSTKIEFSTADKIEVFSPRVCDCEFCVSRDISYLSDPRCYAIISSVGFLRQRDQGDKLASFWFCNNCDEFVAATCKFEDILKGSLNAKLFVGKLPMENPITVSPKLMSSQEKLERWYKVWMPLVLNTEV